MKLWCSPLIAHGCLSNKLIDDVPCDCTICYEWFCYCWAEYWLNSDALFINLVFLVPGLVNNSNSEYLFYFGQTLLDLLLLGPDVTCFSSLVSMWFEYSGVLFKWEHFIQMIMVHFAPLFSGGGKETSRKLSFEWKNLIGHYSILLAKISYI